jgi:hypothetical protein
MGEEKTYYLWIDKKKDDLNIVDIIPSEKDDKDFYKIEDNIFQVINFPNMFLL